MELYATVRQLVFLDGLSRRQVAAAIGDQPRYGCKDVPLLGFCWANVR